MTKCFICQKPVSNSQTHAIADLYKEPELRFHGGGRIRSIIHLEDVNDPKVIKYKPMVAFEWKINPFAKKKVGEA